MLATALPKGTLVQILAVLVKAKILINEEQEQYDINPCEWPLFCTQRYSVDSSLGCDHSLQVKEDSSELESAYQVRGLCRNVGGSQDRG